MVGIWVGPKSDDRPVLTYDDQVSGSQHVSVDPVPIYTDDCVGDGGELKDAILVCDPSMVKSDVRFVIRREVDGGLFRRANLQIIIGKDLP
jgi:hypothetical protein